MKTAKITTVFDNTVLDPKFQSAWGFACVIELPETAVLFDTGGDGKILLSNLQIMGFDPTEISTVIISHMHWDHKDGLPGFLQKNPYADVFVVKSSDAVERKIVAERAKGVFTVDAPRQIVPGLYSLGELPGRMPEKSLALPTADGLVVITGCAHPGIVEIVKHARKQFPDQPVSLVMGGFHLKDHNPDEVEAIIKDMEKMRVGRVSPTHCTGEAAIEAFTDAYGENHLQGGVGFQIEIPLER